eukprot:CAMPEP_0172747422 /NCGR_PEP_ID=MMETSP1074-20121228/142750_1 /TAXON_ID=2916 /ORGANISM="Ceratium fusus, Strain PA161109" /LENGTH=187 /DNA_ID=CAMNT_0013578937 /DNA_START=316 /DNA_END=878 /DNA_ORIENTATION=-
MSKSNRCVNDPESPSTSNAETAPSMMQKAIRSPSASTSVMSMTPLGMGASIKASLSGGGRPKQSRRATSAASSPKPLPSRRKSNRSKPPLSERPPQRPGWPGSVETKTWNPSFSTAHCVGCPAPQDNVYCRVIGPWSFVQTRILPSAATNKEEVATALIANSEHGVRNTAAACAGLWQRTLYNLAML